MAALEKPKRSYTKTELFLGNFVVVGWILLGAAACGLFNLFAAVAFLALAGFLVYYELGKKGCLSCYYCQTCTIGMGKLFDAFFTKAGTDNLNRKARRLFPYVFLLLSAVPIALTVVSIFLEFAIFKLVLLVALIAFSVVSGVARRKVLLHG
jgi:hypothetical protein